MRKKNLMNYRDINVQILEKLDNILLEMKIQNALTRKSLHGEHEGMNRAVKKDTIKHELYQGKLIKTRDVMRMFKCSKPTAIRYMTDIANDTKTFILKDYKGSKGFMLALKR